MKLPTYPILFKQLFILLVITGSFSACKKKDDKDESEDEKPARIAIVNASPGSPELSFYYNRVKSNSTPLSYGTILEYKDFKAEKPSSAPALAITENGKSDTLFRTNFYVAPEKSYTVFIADIPERMTFAISEDQMKAPATDKANIRFANLSPDGGELDINISGPYGYEQLFNMQSFKSVTRFVSIDPREKANIQLKEKGKQDVLITLSDVKIEKGKIYTVLLRGLRDNQNEDSRLVLSLITNK
nr:DUF4397 domain-containing protein [Pedobacter panaciterrae]